MEKTIIKQDIVKPVLVYRDPSTKLQISRVIERNIAVIGRSSKADISIDYEKLSRNHFMIYKEAGTYKVKDLDSTNGIKINGKKMKLSILVNETEIEAAGIIFKFLITNKDYTNRSFNEIGLTSPVFERITNSNKKTYKINITNNKIMIFALVIGAILLSLFFLPDNNDNNKKENEMKVKAIPVIKTMGQEVKAANLSTNDTKKAMLSYKLAEHHFKFGNYKLAKKAMQNYLDIIPTSDLAPAFIANCEDAIKKLSKVDDKIKEMQEEEKKKATIELLLKSAKECMSETDYECAIERYERVLEIDEFNKDANDGILRADNLQSEMEKNTIAEETPEEEVPTENTLDYDKEWDLRTKQMQTSYDNKDYIRAYEISVEILKEKPEITGYSNQNEASKIKNKITSYYNKKFASKMRRAKLMTESDAKTEAVAIYKKILRRFPYHKPAKYKLRKLYSFFHEKSQKLYKEALVSYSYQDIDTAKVKLKQIIKTLPKRDRYYKKAKALLRKILKQEEL